MKFLSPILALIVSNAVFAADTPTVAPSRADPAMERYAAAAERQDWKSAAGTMKDALAGNPSNPDYHNLYAYSLRRSGASELDLVFKHYNEALRLDPKHRGALDKLCFFGCSEYNDLKRAISTFEAKTAK